MSVRIIFLIFAFLLFTNLIILLISIVTNQNLYKTHGKLIINCYGILAIILILAYFGLSFMGITE